MRQYSHSITTHKTAEQIWHLYASPETWNSWDIGNEYLNLKGPLAAGTTFEYKLKNGPIVFPIFTHCEPQHRLTDITKLFLATLTFNRELQQDPAGLRVTHTMTIKGPLAFYWGWIIGNNFAATLPTVLQNLVNKA